MGKANLLGSKRKRETSNVLIERGWRVVLRLVGRVSSLDTPQRFVKALSTKAIDVENWLIMQIWSSCSLVGRISTIDVGVKSQAIVAAIAILPGVEV